MMEKTLHCKTYIILNYRLVGLEKFSSKAIRTWCFVGVDVIESFLYLLFCNGSEKGIFIHIIDYGGDMIEVYSSVGICYKGESFFERII